MALASAQVIDALAARLAGGALAGSRVFTDRAWPIEEGELPAWRVAALDESAERQYVGESINEHVLTVQLEGLVRAVSGVDDAMHALAAEGMTLLFAAPLLYRAQLLSINRRLSAEGEASIGVITVLVETRFAVDQTAPEIIL